MLLNNDRVLGIDIGSNSIKIVEIEEVGTSYRLISLGEAPLSKGSIVDKKIVDPEAVSDTLSKLLDDLSIEADDAGISLSGDPVLLKRVSLPSMSDAELKKSIKWEFEKLNGGGEAGVFSYDYDVLSTQNSRDMIDVLIVAANKDVTKEYLSIVTNVGLNPVLIDLDIFSLQSVYDVNYPESTGVLAIVNIGASVTNVLIMDGGEVVFAKDIQLGGDIYTNSLMSELGLSYEEAEEVKHNQRAGLSDSTVDTISTDFINVICVQINEILDGFSANYNSENVKRIMIAGGSSTMPGLKDCLSEVTGSYVGLLNPFRNIDYSKDTFDPEYIEDMSAKMNIAVGLALRMS